MSDAQRAPHDEPDKIEPGGRDGRMMYARWILERPAANQSIQAVLSVSHHGNTTRAYVATLYQTTVTDEGVFVSEDFGDLMANGVRIAMDAPGPRFSKKGLQAAVETAVAALRERAEDPQVLDRFVPGWLERHEERRRSR